MIKNFNKILFAIFCGTCSSPYAQETMLSVEANAAYQEELLNIYELRTFQFDGGWTTPVTKFTQKQHKQLSKAVGIPVYVSDKSWPLSPNMVAKVYQDYSLLIKFPPIVSDSKIWCQQLFEMSQSSQKSPSGFLNIFECLSSRKEEITTQEFLKPRRLHISVTEFGPDLTLEYFPLAGTYSSGYHSKFYPVFLLVNGKSITYLLPPYFIRNNLKK